MKESPILAARGIPTSYPPSSPFHHCTPAEVRDFFDQFQGPFPKQFDQSLADIPSSMVDRPGIWSIWPPGVKARELTCPICGETADKIWFTDGTCQICHRKAVYLGNLLTAGLVEEQYETKGLWVKAMGFKKSR
jgi:hypothetical protein